MQDALPNLSLIIPCRNEKNFIGQCLDSILAADYPHDKLEILVMDGVSDDGTRDILKEYRQRHPCIKVLKNPDLLVSFALNEGICQSKGDLVIIMGAHALYDKNFLAKNVEHIISHKEVDCVGGVCITLPANQKLISGAIALALSSPFGVGNAYFRIGSSKARYVDTVPFGCYRREVFGKIGYFDEDLTRGQDGEFNARLIKNGGKILLHPEIKSYYYARDSLVKLWKMYYQYGYFKCLAAKKIGRLCAFRQLMPPSFAAASLVTLCLSWLSNVFLCCFAVIFGTYLAANVFASLKMSSNNYRYRFFLPAAFFAIHFAWGFGFLKGFLDFMVIKKEPHQKLRELSLTR